ncbi:hypothetical protein TIFTF001_053490, partial [Ficus carica]
LLAWSKPLRVAGDAHRGDRLDHHSQVLVLFAGELTLVWGLLDGRGGVGSVAVNDIDILHVEVLERGLGALDAVFPREALVVWAGAAPENLGGDDDVGAAPAELADSLAHDLLGAAVGVDLGIVEEVDAVVAAALEEGLRLLLVQLIPEAHP